MARSRFGNLFASRQATVGAVYSALVGDSLLRDQLGIVYRKLFEGAGVRQGADPDHFLYVQPSKARCEVQDISRWVEERFGEPGARVPATTPFGYLSSRWQGWVTYFAALAANKDAKLRANFDQKIAPMTWTAAAQESTRQVEAGSVAAETKAAAPEARAEAPGAATAASVLAEEPAPPSASRPKAERASEREPEFDEDESWTTEQEEKANALARSVLEKEKRKQEIASAERELENLRREAEREISQLRAAKRELEKPATAPSPAATRETVSKAESKAAKKQQRREAAAEEERLRAEAAAERVERERASSGLSGEELERQAAERERVARAERAAEAPAQTPAVRMSTTLM